MTPEDSGHIYPFHFESLHRVSPGMPQPYHISLAYPHTQSWAQESVPPSGSMPSSYPGFSGRTFEFNTPAQSYPPRPENSYFIDTGLMGHRHSLGIDFLSQPPLPTPTPSSSDPFFGVFPTQMEHGGYFAQEQSPFEGVSFPAQVPDFSNGCYQPHFEYPRRAVQETLGGPPFAPSVPLYGIAPQPTSSDVTYRTGNVFPPPPSSNPFASDTFSYCLPTSSANLAPHPSTILDSISQEFLTQTATLDPNPLALKSHRNTDSQDNDRVDPQLEEPRATKISRIRNRATEEDDEYRPSPPKRHRKLASKMPSLSLATRSLGAPESLWTLKHNDRDSRPRKSRTTRLAATHPSGYHLGETGGSNIHQWLRVYFTPSKAQKSLRICPFCGVSDTCLPRHVLSNVNHGIDWMLGILEGTLCGSLLLDALNFTTIWAETHIRPLLSHEAAERDLLVDNYNNRSSHAVQGLRFGAKPFEALCRIALDWAKETDAKAYKCSCNMKATLRKDVFLRHLRTSRECRARLIDFNLDW